MDPQSINYLVDILMSALLASLQLVAIVFHIKLPPALQAILDAKITATAGGGGVSPVESVAPPPKQRETCLPWLATSAITRQQQRVQELPDSAETETWWNDCGETCASMVIEAVWGVYVPPDVLRIAGTGQRSTGLTTSRDLYVMLSQCHVGSFERTWGPTEWLAASMKALNDGRPVIALGRWPTPGGVLHWLLMTAIGGGVVKYINPWSGIDSWLSFQDWNLYATGDYVEVASHLHFAEDIPF